MNAPTTFLDFIRLFPDEEACGRFLYQLRWPQGFICPSCGDRRARRHRTRGLVQCGNGHQVSLTANTAMHRSKQSLTLWFWGAYLVATLTPGISALQFQKQLGIKRYETAFNLLHKLRSALVAPDREPLKGEVEVDEAYIGGPEEGRPGRGAVDKALIIVGVEIVRWEEERWDEKEQLMKPVQRKRAGRTRMNVIPNAQADTLLGWVKKNVAKGTLVYTDGHKSYGGIVALGYGHRPVLQRFKGKKTGEYLPMVHLVISNLKRWLLGTHKGAVLPKHLQAYLNEFAFRFNRRFWKGPAFLRALGLLTHAQKWPEYETLYAAGEQDGWRHPSFNLRPLLSLQEIVDAAEPAWKPSLAKLLEEAGPSGKQ